MGEGPASSFAVNHSRLSLPAPRRRPPGNANLPMGGFYDATAQTPLTPQEQSLQRKTHQTLRRVTQDFETRWHFNSAIALIMELTNEIYAAEPLEPNIRPEIRREALEKLVLMLAPMTPHLSEELWEMLGHTEGLWTVSWPQYSEELARENEVEIPVQVNGRLRGKVKVAAGAAQDEVVALAQAESSVAPHVSGKQLKKIVFVPDKLLNLVVG